MSTTKVQEKRRKGVPAPATGRAAKRVVVDFPESLYKETEKGAAELATNRSGFVRLAVEKLVAELRRKKLEKELAQGYIVMTELSQQVSDDFKHVDLEWE